MPAGRYRHRVDIDRRIDTPLPDGGIDTTWVLFAERVPAEIAPLSAKELVVAQATQSEATTRITIPWMPGMLPTMRIRRRDDGRVYNIAGVVEDNRSGREWITLPCSEGLNDG